MKRFFLPAVFIITAGVALWHNLKEYNTRYVVLNQANDSIYSVTGKIRGREGEMVWMKGKYVYQDSCNGGIPVTLLATGTTLVACAHPGRLIYVQGKQVFETDSMNVYEQDEFIDSISKIK